MAVFLSACGAKSSSTGGGNTDLQMGPFSIEAMGTFTQQEVAFQKARIQVGGATLEQLSPTKCGVSAYRINYQTVDTNGMATMASGAVFLPVGKNGGSLISYQHGTTTSRALAPSMTLQSESALAASVYVGNCMALVSADYLGLGSNTGFHPYLHADTEASASADLLILTLKKLSEVGYVWDHKLFLAGYSQGGHATMALHRLLEKSYPNFPVTASAPMAGPYDLSNTSMKAAAKGFSSTYTPLYSGYLAFAFQKIYKTFQIEDVVKQQYANMLSSLFDGSAGFEKISESLPAETRDLLTDDFINTVTLQQQIGRGEILAALRLNDVYNWTPQAPVRLYHGRLDRDVPFDNAIVACNFMNANGYHVSVHEFPNADHETAYFPSLFESYNWFTSF